MSVRKGRNNNPLTIYVLKIGWNIGYFVKMERRIGRGGGGGG